MVTKEITEILAKYLGQNGQQLIKKLATAELMTIEAIQAEVTKIKAKESNLPSLFRKQILLINELIHAENNKTQSGGQSSFPDDENGV